MTSTSPRIREILASNGDKHSLWKWSLAFQCVVNIGVRGTEAIRTRVVEVGAVHVVLAILENFLQALERAKIEKDQERNKPFHQLINNGNTTALHDNNNNNSINNTTTTTSNNSNNNNNNNTAVSLPTIPLPPQSRSTPVTTSRRIINMYSQGQNNTNNNSNNTIHNSTGTTSSTHQRPNPLTAFLNSADSSSIPSSSPILPISLPPFNNFSTSNISFEAPKRKTFLSHKVKSKPKNKNTCLSSIPLLNSLSIDAILHREEDILLSLQLLAYLSKYSHIRQTFHNNHSKNVFSVVEKFTHRIHPQTIIYWAGVIMRNACRKDESQGGIRQCAYMHCGKWERFPREFAKCRRCRKAKYCSKNCQSRAWAEGHRWWCVERNHSHSSHVATTLPTTTVTAPVTTEPPVDNTITATDQLGSLDENTTTTHIPINLDESRQQQQQHDQASLSISHQDQRALSDENDNGNNSVGVETEEEESNNSSRSHRHHHHQQRSSLASSVTNDQLQQQRSQQQRNTMNITTTTTASTISPSSPHNDTLSERLLPNQQSLMFYHRRRRHSRSAQSLASGSSTEVEVDTTESMQSIQREEDLMEID
ncbi:unnamed protein product [Cunninghamella blakesleeana]